MLAVTRHFVQPGRVEVVLAAHVAPVCRQLDMPLVRACRHRAALDHPPAQPTHAIDSCTFCMVNCRGSCIYT